MTSPLQNPHDLAKLGANGCVEKLPQNKEKNG